jgi:excisionase family DNA binding protein
MRHKASTRNERSRAPVERTALSVGEVAESTGLSERTVWALIGDNRLRVVRIGRRTLVPIAAMRAMFDRDDGESGDGGVLACPTTPTTKPPPSRQAERAETRQTIIR